MKHPTKPLKGHSDEIQFWWEEKLYFAFVFSCKTNFPESVTQENVFNKLNKITSFFPHKMIWYLIKSSAIKLQEDILQRRRVCFQCTIDLGCSHWLYVTDFFTRWESPGRLLSSRGQRLMPSFVWVCLYLRALLKLWSARTEETLEDNRLYVLWKAASFWHSLPFCIHHLLFLLSGRVTFQSLIWDKYKVWIINFSSPNLLSWVGIYYQKCHLLFYLIVFTVY